MANKRPKPEESVAKLRRAAGLAGQGMPRLNAPQPIGVTEQTFYRWQKNGALLRHCSERQWRRVEWAQTK